MHYLGLPNNAEMLLWRNIKPISTKLGKRVSPRGDFREIPNVKNLLQNHWVNFNKICLKYCWERDQGLLKHSVTTFSRGDNIMINEKNIDI